MDFQPKKNFSAWLLVLVLTSLILILFYGGYQYYLKQRNDIKEEQHAFLSAISSFKVREIEGWIGERKAEGCYLASCKDFIVLVGSLKSHPDDKKLVSQVENWLYPLKNNHEYIGIWIFSPEGKMLASVSDTAIEAIFPCADANPVSRKSALDSLPKLSYNIENGKWRITHKVPLFDETNLSGFALFVVDPECILFPRVAEWPVKKETGECLLVSHYGDTISYL